MAQEILYGIILIVFLGVQVFGLSASIGFDEYIDDKRKRIFFIILVLVIGLIVQNGVEFWLIWFNPAPYVRTIVAMLGYIIRPFIIVLFMYIVSQNRHHYVGWFFAGINAVVHLTALFSDICFTIGDSNNYRGGPLSSACLIISSIMLAYLLYLTILEFKNIKKRESLIPLFLIFVVVASIVCDALFNDKHQMIDYVTIAISLVTVFYYIWVHLKFVRVHEKDLVAEQRIKNMLSQIQPHFIYNSLNAIQAIDGVPENAQNAIIDFSKFLRENLDSLTGPDLVPFEKELEHVKKYVSLEKLRFGEKVNVVYNVSYSHFLLPVLTLQMLVENAIKHGITKKYEGGTVTVTVKQDGDNIVIIVEDNGVGFDTMKEIDESHVGLSNIEKRLQHFVDGSLYIESAEGEGTTVTIVIPKSSKTNLDIKKV